MLDKIALALVIIGGINWGLIGLFGFDLVGWLFGGQGTVISRIIFGLVGLAGIWACTFYSKLPSDSNTSTKHS